MYNRYISQEHGYGPIPRQEPEPSPEAGPKGLLGGLLRGAGEGCKGLSALLKSLGLKELDAGDVLLVLVALLLILEDGDQLEVLIALALALLLGLGEP